MEQSSLFSHAMNSSGTIGEGFFEGNGGSVGRSGGNSANGGGRRLVGPLTGANSSSSGISTLSVIGTTTGGLTDCKAMQWFVGLPVVPGGHIHDGL